MEAQHPACLLVQSDDLATHFGALGDRPSRPRHAERERAPARQFGDPVAAVAVESGHRRDERIGFWREGTCDQNAVAGVILVHVAQHGGDDGVIESMRHGYTIGVRRIRIRVFESGDDHRGVRV